MKGIIAKLEEERAAVLAGGKRHAAQRAKLSALTMLSFVLLSACEGAVPEQSHASVASHVGGAPPITEDAGWTSPDGRFYILLPRDWGKLDVPNAPREMLAHFGQTTRVVTRTECFVQAAPRAEFNGREQSAINEAVAGWSEAHALRHAGGGGFRRHVVAFDASTVDGVAVVTLVLDVSSASETMRYYSRQFVLAGGSAATYHALNCISEQGADPDNAANEALVNSLRFIR